MLTSIGPEWCQRGPWQEDKGGPGEEGCHEAGGFPWGPWQEAKGGLGEEGCHEAEVILGEPRQEAEGEAGEEGCHEAGGISGGPWQEAEGEPSKTHLHADLLLPASLLLEQHSLTVPQQGTSFFKGREEIDS